MVAEGVAGVVDQANPCGLAAGLGLSNAGLGPAYILFGGFRLVCGWLVCAGHVQGMGMGMGVVAFAGHGGFRRAWWLSPGVVAGGRCRKDAVQHGGLCRCACEVDPHHLRPQRRAFCQSSSEPRQWLGARASSIPQQFSWGKSRGLPAHDLKPRGPNGAEGAEWSRAEPSGAERSRAERGTPSLNGLSAELNLEPCYFCRAKGPRKGVVLILIVLMAQDQDLHDSS